MKRSVLESYFEQVGSLNMDLLDILPSPNLMDYDKKLFYVIVVDFPFPLKKPKETILMQGNLS